MMDLRELVRVTEGQWLGPNSGAFEFSSVSIDTRTLQPGALYIALRGERFDGHEFIVQAAAAGARACLVEYPLENASPQLQVADSRRALGQLAHAWREQHDCPVVAVTGSNGKTTVKEMLTAILTTQGRTLATQGNLNNDIGVPLTLLRLQPSYQYAVVELGANHLGEIAYSAGLTRPDVAVITNAGAAHLEGFGGRDQVAEAKGEIIDSLSAAGVAVLNAGDRYFARWKARAGQRRVLTFGLTPDADVYAHNIHSELSATGFLTRFQLHYAGQVEIIELALAGQHNVLNALTASAACLALEVPLSDLARGLADVKPVPGRMQVLSGLQGCRVIHDAYNANPSSLQAALEALANLDRETWLVLGAFAELGPESADLHSGLGHAARSQGVTRLYATGLEANRAVTAFGSGGRYFEEQGDLIRALQADVSKDAVVLVKGSRSQHMEHVVDALTAGQDTF